MSVIAVDGVPLKFSLIHVVKILAKTINGHFEALNFKDGGRVKGVKVKTCYLRLSEKLDPVRVVEKINEGQFPKHFRPYAYIPDHVPDIPLAAKPKRIPQQMRRALRIREDDDPEKAGVCPETIPCKIPGKSWWDAELECERRKLRRALNRAMNTNADKDWDAYRLARSSYKKCIRFKSSIGRKFDVNIESCQQTNTAGVCPETTTSKMPVKWDGRKLKRALNRAMNTNADEDWDAYWLARSSYKKSSRFKSSMGSMESCQQTNRIVSLTLDEIMTELQSKYPGLYNLSKKNGHKLLEELATKISDRLSVIEKANAEVDSCFKLSQWYRRMHPHFGDFQLVLSTLHAIEDAAGMPRTQIQEKELSALPPHPYVIDNLPYDKVQQACQKYSERIIKKVSDHVENLNFEVTATDTEDEIIRKKVREELKKMSHFIPLIVNQVVNKHFIQKKTPHYRVRIYGEPFLPSKDTTSPFLRRYHPVRVMRSANMYNLLLFNVPPSVYASLMAMDGTVLNGAKLVIRSSDMPQYKVSRGALKNNDAEPVIDDMDEDQTDDWDEMN